MNKNDPRRRKPEYREYKKLMAKKSLSQTESTRVQELKVILGLDGQSDSRPWWQNKKGEGA